MSYAYRLLLLIIFFLQVSCGGDAWNNPHPQNEVGKNIYFASFSESPKTLDPARAYNSDEIMFIAQIYEPPLQYHFLKRPYQLIPLTATEIPQPVYLDKNGQVLKSDAKPQDIAFSVYEIKIRPGILYQPHPAFAQKNGNYLYHHLSPEEVNNIDTLGDFKQLGSRELTAEDYVYQIKRVGSPQTKSPIFGLMSNYILGLDEFQHRLAVQQQSNSHFADYIDLRNFPLQGAKVIDRYTYQIILKGQYPQFIFWLAMPFFAPVPWEADKFYSQAALKEKNITWDWYPIGTGPYMLTENNPNRQMQLEKNSNFHGEIYPYEGEQQDRARGMLADAGKALPFIDKFIFSLEKESIPRWTKFLQGYYDQSGITSDNFDQAIKIDRSGQPYLSSEMQQQHIQLQTNVSPGIYYMGFNMLDDVVGGYSERAKKLRQAISIALDYEEFISIFLNGRGVIAQGPIPPGIFGYTEGAKGINPYIYNWDQNKIKRKSLATAKQLLAEAGYPEGRDAKTGAPLILYFDTGAGGGPDDKAQFDWYRKQFAKLGIQLQIRATQYNRFQEKMRTGNTQIFSWGWLADYPDPENFLFLLYGPNGKVKFGGENAANYQNPQFDSLFNAMKILPNGPERQQLIQQMIAIVQEDAPWIWGFYPQTFQLSHQWVRQIKPNEIANNTLKYLKLDPHLRVEKQKIWNQPILWPVGLAGLILIVSLIPVIINYWRKEHRVN